MSNCKCSCSCSSSKQMVYACSGASDVGELTDKIARRMAKANNTPGGCISGMGCLAGIGADLSGMVESAKLANQIIAIDGCSVSCAKKLLEAKGIKTKSFNLKDLGFEKGKTPCNDYNIEKAIKLIMEKL